VRPDGVIVWALTTSAARFPVTIRDAQYFFMQLKTSRTQRSSSLELAHRRARLADRVAESGLARPIVSSRGLAGHGDAGSQLASSRGHRRVQGHQRLTGHSIVTTS